MRIVSIVFFTILAVLATIFVIQNGQMTQIRFFSDTARFESPLSLWLLGCLAVGFVLCWLASIPSRWRRSREIKGYKDQIVRLERELQEEKANNEIIAPPLTGGETMILPPTR